MIMFQTKTSPCGGSGGHWIHHCVISIKLQFLVPFISICKHGKSNRGWDQSLGFTLEKSLELRIFNRLFKKNAILFTDPWTFYCQLLQFNNWWGETSAASSARQHKAEPTLVRWAMTCTGYFNFHSLFCTIAVPCPVIPTAHCCFVKFHTTHRLFLHSLFYSLQNLVGISFINDEKYSDPCL